MIITETFKIGNQDFIRTYSDREMMIHGGVPEGDYPEAYDPAELNRTYIETDIPIDNSDSSAQEILDILVGAS